jgi:hypothetical protein
MTFSALKINPKMAPYESKDEANPISCENISIWVGTMRRGGKKFSSCCI